MSEARTRYRHAHEAGAGAGFAWANEAFSFQPNEYEIVTRMFPDLKAPDDEIRRKAWVRFAQTDIGKAFRVR